MPADAQQKLLNALHSRGVNVVVADFAKLSLRDQARSVCGAHVLLGAHGAGLVNAGFLRPGAALFEYSNATKREFHYFRNIATIVRARYAWFDMADLKGIRRAIMYFRRSGTMRRKSPMSQSAFDLPSGLKGYTSC